MHSRATPTLAHNPNPNPNPYPNPDPNPDPNHNQCHWTLGLYSSTIDQVRVHWKNNTDALGSWDTQRCSSEWAAVAMEQKDDQAVWPGIGTYSYAKASVTFVRAQPENIIDRYFFVGVALVFLSYLGAWINPAATPARVALSIITILTVVNNYQSLMLQLPVNQPHPVPNHAARPGATRPTPGYLWLTTMACKEVSPNPNPNPNPTLTLAGERGGHLAHGAALPQHDLQLGLLRGAGRRQLWHGRQRVAARE